MCISGRQVEYMHSRYLPRMLGTDIAPSRRTWTQYNEISGNRK